MSESEAPTELTAALRARDAAVAALETATTGALAVRNALHEADRAVTHARREVDEARRRIAQLTPVDRTKVELTDGSPVPTDGSHREDRGDGQQKGYVVLSEEERKRGFVRPYRETYVHVGRKCCGKYDPVNERLCLKQPNHDGACDDGNSTLWHKVSVGDDVEAINRRGRFGGCGSTTTMNRALSETYARDPHFYSGTFCATCRSHYPLDQFVWDGTDEQVGT